MLPKRALPWTYLFETSHLLPHSDRSSHGQLPLLRQGVFDDLPDGMVGGAAW